MEFAILSALKTDVFNLKINMKPREFKTVEIQNK